MNIILWIIIITTICGVLGTGLGGVIGAIVHNASNKVLSLFLNFAAGIMISIVCFDLIDSALHSDDVVTLKNVFLVVSFIFIGYAIVYFLNSFINKINDKRNKKNNQINKAEDSGYRLFIAGLVMASAIAIHNLPEGVVIGASFANGDRTDIINKSGLVMAIVIGLHNIPEGMAVCVPLIAGGMKRWKAVLATASTGIPTVIGSVIGYSLGIISDLVLSMSLSFASGAMIYVVFSELIPEGYSMWKSKASGFSILVGILVGIIIINI